MQPQRLTEPVLISGYGLAGFQTDLVLRPVDLPGWNIQFASTQGDNPIFPLRRGWLVHCSMPMSSIELAYHHNGHEHVAQVIEHLLAVREGMGLYDGVLVVIGRRGIPFTGHAGHFLQRVRPVLAPATLPTRCWTASDVVGPIKTPDGRGFIEFVPSKKDALRLVVSIDYPQYGIERQEFMWASGSNTFDDVAWTRGELKPFFRPFVHLSEHLGWPHAWAFADITRMPGEEWAWHVIRHRVLDLLGELGTVCGTGKLSGTCYCHCAGHHEAVQLVRRLRQGLVEIAVRTPIAAE